MTQKTSRRGFLKAGAAGLTAVALAGCITTDNRNEAQLLGERYMPVTRVEQTAKAAGPLPAAMDQATVDSIYQTVNGFDPNTGSGYFDTYVTNQAREAFKQYTLKPGTALIRKIDFTEQRTGLLSKKESVAEITDLIHSLSGTGSGNMNNYSRLTFDNPQMVGGITDVYVLSSRNYTPDILFQAHTTKGFDNKLNAKDTTTVTILIPDEDTKSEFKHRTDNYRKLIEYLEGSEFATASAPLHQPIVGLGGYAAEQGAEAFMRGFLSLFHSKPEDVRLYPHNGFHGDAASGSNEQKFWSLFREEGVAPFNHTVPIHNKDGAVDTYLILKSERRGIEGDPIIYTQVKQDAEGHFKGIEVKTAPYKGKNHLEQIIIGLEGAAAKGAAQESLIHYPEPETVYSVLWVPTPSGYVPVVVNHPAEISGTGHFGPGITNDSGTTGNGGSGIQGGFTGGPGVAKLYEPSRREMLFFGQCRNA